MVGVDGKTQMTGRLAASARILLPVLGAVFVIALVVGFPAAQGSELKLVDAPLSQVIELYSRETGKNVFLDETVQKNRQVTAHIPDMDIESAFEVVKSILGLQSCRIDDKTMLLYPPERANLYNLGMKPMTLKAPEGVDPKWLTTLVNSIAPNVRVSPLPKDEQTLLLFGPPEQLAKVRTLAGKFPDLTVTEQQERMNEGEAKLAKQELKLDGVETETSSGGLVWRGRSAAVNAFREKLTRWRRDIKWKQEVYTPRFLDSAKAFRAAEASKGRAVIAELGGTGSLLVDGPADDHRRVLSILKTLDENAKPVRREVSIGELKPEMAREAIKGGDVRVEGYGNNRLILVGQDGAVENAAGILQMLSKKNRQVLIRFRLAEIAKGKLKNLGIDLDKSTYTYGEIKEFHPKDVLPLLLQVLEEGKDARILAQPNVRVIEGEEAKIVIGDRIPLEVAATAQTDAGSTLKLNTQLTWVDVGIKMTVEKVRVNPDGSIRMGLKTEVSSVVGTTKQGYPQIRTREAASILRVDNGGAVIMGGLLSREDRRRDNRIPILSHVPLVGWLMRSNQREQTNTEIVMVVTAILTQD
jgi:type II secretory pathway component GspD/PulD (secretin)